MTLFFYHGKRNAGIVDPVTCAIGRRYLWPLQRNSTRTLFLLSCSFLARAGTSEAPRVVEIRAESSGTRVPAGRERGWLFFLPLSSDAETTRRREGEIGERSAPPPWGKVARCISNVRTWLSRIPTEWYLDSNAQKKHRTKARKSEDPRSLCAGRSRRGNERLSDPPFWYLQFSPQRSDAGWKFTAKYIRHRHCRKQ